MKDLAACAPETTATLRSSPEQSPSEADSHAMTASTLAMSGSEDDTASDPPSLSPAVAPSPAIKEWEPRLQLVVDIDHTLVHSVSSLPHGACRLGTPKVGLVVKTLACGHGDVLMSERLAHVRVCRWWACTPIPGYSGCQATRRTPTKESTTG